MVAKKHKAKPVPAPATPIEWTRADPAELAKFDPASKVCTMNCGQHGHDPRTRVELKFLCDDCDIRPPKKEPAPRPMIDSGLFAEQLAKVAAAEDAYFSVRGSPPSKAAMPAVWRTWREALDVAERAYHVEAGTLAVQVRYEVDRAAE